MNKEQQRISVIIPCYNSAAYLQRAVDSALQQTLKPLEIILVDNGSADTTWELMTDYQNQYPELVRILKQPIKGAPAARNMGLEAARGEWIQFLDSDDELLPQKMERQLAIALSTGADMIAGSCFIDTWQGTKATRRTNRVQSEDTWMGLITSRLGRTTSNLFRKTALQQAGGWNTGLRSSQEYNLMFRMLEAGSKLACCDEPLAVINVQENSIHRSRDEQRSQEITNTYLDLRIRIREHLARKGLLTPKMKRDIDLYLYGCIKNHEKGSPDFVRNKIRELDLRIPASLRIRRILRKWRHQLGGAIRQMLHSDSGGNKQATATANQAL